MKKYIVSIYDDSEYNAGPKAKKDVEDILVEDNFEKISLKFKLNNSLRSKILKIKYKYIDIPLSLSKIEKNSIVFLQYPAYSSFILKIISKNKLIILIFRIKIIRHIILPHNKIHNNCNFCKSFCSPLY